MDCPGLQAPPAGCVAVGADFIRIWTDTTGSSERLRRLELRVNTCPKQFINNSEFCRFLTAAATHAPTPAPAFVVVIGIVVYISLGFFFVRFFLFPFFLICSNLCFHGEFFPAIRWGFSGAKPSQSILWPRQTAIEFRCK